jgi:hypothetical protein
MARRRRGHDPSGTTWPRSTDDPAISMNGLETCMALSVATARHLQSAMMAICRMVSLRDILLHDLNEKDDAL